MLNLEKSQTNDDFNYGVIKIDSIISIYEDFLINKDGIKYIFREGNFSYQNKTYKYQLIWDNTVLYLNTNMDAGHGGASGRFETLKELAKEYAFLLDLEQIKK